MTNWRKNFVFFYINLNHFFPHYLFFCFIAIFFNIFYTSVYLFYYVDSLFTHFYSDNFILSIFIPQNRYDMCRRRKGGRCTKGTAGMVCYIAITLYLLFLLTIFITYLLWCSAFAGLYIVDGMLLLTVQVMWYILFTYI